VFATTETRLGAGVAVLVSVVYLGAAQLPFLQSLEGFSLDLRFRVRAPRLPSDTIVVIAIDDRSIEDIGRWAWSRSVFAEAVKRLQAAGARTIAFDLLFASPQETLSSRSVHELRAALNVFSAKLGKTEKEIAALHQITRRLDAELNADQQFAEAIEKAGNVILPFSFAPSDTEFNARSIEKIAAKAAYRTMKFSSDDRSQLATPATVAMLPIDMLAQSANSLGHANVVLDADGAARYEHPIIPYREEYYPSIAIQIARHYLGYAMEEVSVNFGTGIRLGRLRISTDPEMRMPVNYYGANGSFDHISYMDLINDRVDDGLLRDKIVLIGPNAVGITNTFESPFSPALNSTERIATTVENILTGEQLFRTGHQWIFETMCALAVGLILGVGARLRPFRFTLYAATTGSLLVVGNYFAFAQFNLWLNVTFPLLSLAITYTVLLLYGYVYKMRQERSLTEAFGRYLHPTLVRNLIEQGFQTEPQSRLATVLFTDIEGFTGIAESVSPEELRDLLNQYFTCITEPIEQNGGMVTQYQGDAVLAVFNIPSYDADHAKHAARAALGIQKVVEDGAFLGNHRLTTRIGINTGKVVAGAVGSRDRVTYTVHGDAVNVAARLEAMNKDLGTRVLLSEHTMSLLDSEFRCRPIGDLDILGKQQSIGVFELLSNSDGESV